MFGRAGCSFSEQGFAFVTPVPRKFLFPFRVQGAGPAVKASSTLVLFEDGFPLGPIDAGHVNVPSQGKGQYFHWGDDLYFSSSDGTDPRSNGRLYSYRVQSALHPIAFPVALLLAALAVFGLAVYSARQRFLDTAEAQNTSYEPHIFNIGRAVVVLGLLGLVALWLVAAMSVPQEGTLDASVIKHARPFGYVAPIEIGVRWPLRAAAARGSAVPGSALTIAENHKQVGRYELNPRKLTDQGAGRYALYGDRLIFSTLDRTDPRTNGRTYNWKLPVEVDPAAWISLLAILAVGVLLSFRASVLRGLIWLEGKSLVRIGAPSALDRTSTVKGLTVVFRAPLLSIL